MGEEARFWVVGLCAYGAFAWGMIQWAISQHQALRKELTKHIEDANTAMNNRMLDVQRSVQVVADQTRDRIDTCAAGLRLDIAGKADRASFEKVTDRIFELLDEQRDRMLEIVRDARANP